MKLICTQENLKAGLGVVGRIVSSSNTLPILNNFLLKTEGGVLEISSTNLEVAIKTQVRCKVEEGGSVTVSGKIFTDLVNNLPNQNVNIQTEGNELKIDLDNYHTSINTTPSDEFPLIPLVEAGQKIKIQGQDLKKALDQVAFAASTNQTQQEITGVLFLVQGSELKVVATDRYRLAEKKVSLPEKIDSFHESIVPQKTSQEISRIIGQQPGEVEMVFTETQMLFNFNNTIVVSRLVDGQYPDYKQIIPGEFVCSATVKRLNLANSLKTTAVFSRGSNSVNIRFDEAGQKIILSAESSDLGKSVVELPCVLKGNGEIILNYHYISECLQGVDGEEVILKMNDDNSPCLIVPQEKDDYLYLIMPIKS